MSATELRAWLQAQIELQSRTRQEIADQTPKVLDGHSDGRRVRYVRAEVREAALREVLDRLDR